MYITSIKVYNKLLYTFNFYIIEKLVIIYFQYNIKQFILFIIPKQKRKYHNYK